MARRKADVTHGVVVAREINAEESFRHEWERHAPARLVAAKLIEYRFDHEYSQRELAEVLGVKQPQVVRWESGESLPSPDNLARIAGALSLEFVFSYAPADRDPKQITKTTRERATSYQESGAVVRVAAG